MQDQANTLRGLMERRQMTSRVAAEPPHAIERALSIAVTSGKGGVGKSNLAVNLAVALAKRSASVCVVDANFGVGHVELLCGLSGYWNLLHVLSGARRLSDVLLEGPAGVRLVPGAGCLYDLEDFSRLAVEDLTQQLENLEREYEFLIFDTGSGLNRAVRRLTVSADVALVMTTPEPTSVADAYALLKGLAATDDPPVVEILVNQADSAAEADAVLGRLQRTARTFLHVEPESAGHVPRDPRVAEAVANRTPFVVGSPQCPASQAVSQLARRMLRVRESRPPRGLLLPRLRQRAAAPD